LPATPQQAGPRVPGLMDATIDLTDSPPPGLASPPPAPPSPASPYTGPLSAIQCPICLDSLAAVRRRGNSSLSPPGPARPRPSSCPRRPHSQHCSRSPPPYSAALACGP
jgi:hypothetical protein